jgi:predicted dienelactone hydrolase
MTDGAYDPFVRGRFPVGVRTIQVRDEARDRLFPCEVWYPAAARHAGQDLASESQDLLTPPPGDKPRPQMAVRGAAAWPGTYPLVVFSHGSGRWHRRTATFLCTHLASHGYLVAAADHSEIVAAQLSGRAGETDEDKAARVEAWIANRVPDIRVLLDRLAGGPGGNAWESEAQVDPLRIGIVGHSFGGWTALAATAVDRRIRAVVALTPAGNSRPKPGIIPAKLTFDWGRDVPTLFLAAENDTITPLAGVRELFERTRCAKQMVILRRADHSHFVDRVEEEHETVRAMPFTGPLAWIPQEMRPITELCSGDEAHRFTRGLAVAHMDAFLREDPEARRFLAGDVEAELARRGVAGIVQRP